MGTKPARAPDNHQHVWRVTDSRCEKCGMDRWLRVHMQALFNRPEENKKKE